MHDILELPEVRKQVSRLSVAEYHLLPLRNENGKRTELIRGTVEEYTREHPPTAELAVEIAITSLALDREKALIYAEAGIKEYWIIIPKQQHVEVYRGPEGGVYREKCIYSCEEMLACESVPAIAIPVRDIFPA